MAKIYSLFINAPIDKVWAFIWDFDEWAHLIEGYVSHKKISRNLSHWTFQFDIGPVKKKIDFDLEILSNNAPHSMTFQIIGTNENFTGHGSIETKSLKSNRTFVKGSVDIQTHGPLAKFIKPFIKSSTSNNNIQEFQKEVSKLIQQYER